MADYKQLALEARREVLGLIHRAQTSHIASNFSVIDIATVLYENLKPEDRIVWSKGWAAAAIYYFLYKQGKISYEQLTSFPNDPFLGLAEPSVPGVEVSGGAMGHGLPVAVGIALGYKRAKQDGTIYCIVSDGELNEGTTWESAALAAHHKLDNLVVLIDANRWQAMGRTDEVLNFEPIDKKWSAFGWDTSRLDGHNHGYLETHIRYFSGQMSENSMIADGKHRLIHKNEGNPKVIVCDTLKGKGVSFMTDHLLYHYAHVTDEVYEAALKELQ